MLRYRDGDARAFEILYERHKGPLYRYLQRMCGRREVADDLFQEVWSKVIASRSRYEARAQFNTFLFRIAHNCAVDYFRRSGRPHERAVQDIDDVAEQIGGAEHERPDAALAEAQVRSDFRRALEQLPRRTARRVRAVRGERPDARGNRPDHRGGDGNRQEQAALCGRQAAHGAEAAPAAATSNRVCNRERSDRHQGAGRVPEGGLRRVARAIARSAATTCRRSWIARARGGARCSRERRRACARGRGCDGARPSRWRRLSFSW